MTTLAAVIVMGFTVLASPAVAQDRVIGRAIGLLSLPEVLGPGECERFTPKPLTLHETPRGRVVGSLFVKEPSADGCVEVGVRLAGAAEAHDLPTMEYRYEAPAAIVLEQRDRWFRVRLSAGSAWLQASEVDEFYSLEKLYEDGLTYLTESWNGEVAAAPGASGRPVRNRPPSREPAVRVGRSVRQDGVLWFFVEVMSHSQCTADEPTVADQGWIRAYGKSDEPAIWFYSRGC